MGAHLMERAIMVVKACTVVHIDSVVQCALRTCEVDACLSVREYVHRTLSSSIVKRYVLLQMCCVLCSVTSLCKGIWRVPRTPETSQELKRPSGRSRDLPITPKSSQGTLGAPGNSRELQRTLGSSQKLDRPPENSWEFLSRY